MREEPKAKSTKKPAALAATRSEPSVLDVAREYLDHLDIEVRRGRRSVRTAGEARAALERLVLPTLGARTVSSITLRDLERWVAENAARPVLANRALAYLKAAWNYADRCGMAMPQRHPLRFLRDLLFDETPRDRTLAPAELDAVLAEIEARRRGDDRARRDGAELVLLIILTGFRASEATGLRWENLRQHASLISLPKSKTGAKVIPLGDAAQQLLVMRRARYGETPGPIFGSTCLRRAWGGIRRAAGCPDVTVHDLRRSFAQRVLESGRVDLREVAGLLGQKTLRVTAEHYTPLRAERGRIVANYAQPDRWANAVN